MIGNLDSLGTWQPGEETRFEACSRHRAALNRMDYDAAWDYARKCPDCVAAVRPVSEAALG